jgi:2-dehydro-3-deoxyphosphogluconate aldolase/(4S)-4-hydroxy-2-oxoglutarate aldolase
MAKFTRIEVFQTMVRTKLVPLHYNPDLDVMKGIVKACHDGGARVFEFTNRGDYAHEVFRELNRYCLKELSEMILGVGSVVDGGTASLYLQYGANFIVTPVFREDVARICNRRKVLWSPGCGSVTEVAIAEELGCELVKLFPGGVFGPSMIKAIKAPQPWTNIMPTGGVSPDPENLKGWFDAGATCVGMGSKLITKDIVESRDFKKLERLVKETIGLISEFA